METDFVAYNIIMVSEPQQLCQMGLLILLASLGSPMPDFPCMDSDIGQTQIFVSVASVRISDGVDLPPMTFIDFPYCTSD